MTMPDLKLRECPFCGGNAEEAFLKRKKLFASMRFPYDEALGCDLCSKAKQFAYERPCTPDLLKGLGKTVFLTREEAEAALKEADNA